MSEETVALEPWCAGCGTPIIRPHTESCPVLLEKQRAFAEAVRQRFAPPRKERDHG